MVDLISPERPDARLDFHVAGNLEDDAFVRRLLEQHGPFDVILCLDVLEHLADPWSVVRRLHEALAPDGVIVASIPNIRYFEASFPLFFRGKWTLRDSGVLDRTHLRWFVKQTACELMTSSGLVLEKAISKPGRGRKMKWVMRATLGLLNDFFTVQFLIRVRNRSARF
ncbi:MAG: ubiG 2 [Cypionkella sp.]|nr:ubiG 2 [Cypionkella sp.]